jgi:hypothetical protein
MYNEKLKALYQKEKAAGADSNQATLEVARKLVAYLLAVDRTFWKSAQSKRAA